MRRKCFSRASDWSKRLIRLLRRTKPADLSKVYKSTICAAESAVDLIRSPAAARFEPSIAIQFLCSWQKRM